MKIFFLISHGHRELAKAEITALSNYILQEGEDYLLAEMDESLIGRLALTRIAGELLVETNSLTKLCLPKFKSFAVRCTKILGAPANLSSIEIQKKVGARIKGKVNLENPEVIIRVFTNGKHYFVTRQIFRYSEKLFSCRRVNARPFPHPASLQPRWARLLINLTGTRKGRILDPFCGAGGVLLEAGVMSLHAVGIEKDEKIAEGARENLWFFRVDDKCKVINADFLEWESGMRFDAIVTDLPYGKSSLLFGRELNELYEKSFRKMHEHSNKAVIMGPKDLTKTLTRCGWEVRALYDLYVHRSLRRWIHVCQSNPNKV